MSPGHSEAANGKAVLKGERPRQSIAKRETVKDRLERGSRMPECRSPGAPGCQSIKVSKYQSIKAAMHLGIKLTKCQSKVPERKKEDKHEGYKS